MPTITTDPKALTNERGKTHGDWMKQSSLAYALKGVMRDSDNWPNLPAFRKEALDLIMTKVSRILTGDHNEPDHWDDGSGYFFLGKGGHNGHE